MFVLILKLILAHLVGDFYLQPKKWVKNKEKRLLKSIWLYVHVIIHLVLMLLIIWDLSYWKLIISIGIAHLGIDLLKAFLSQKMNNRLLFFLDQLAHIISILVLTALFYSGYHSLEIAVKPHHLLLITCLVFLTMPCSIIMKTIFTKWDIRKLSKDNKSLKDAGQYIGFLERLLVFIFIAVGRWEAVGFLITAKSVFRFGDLTASKERKLTEYILIGTLISFGLAISTGLLYLNLLSYV
jgi:hypothetical protein